jgi:hypothetical protein
MRSSDEGYADSSATRSSVATNSRRSTISNEMLNANGKPLFRARPVPASVLNPEIIPRTTRAAALRAGPQIEK